MTQKTQMESSACFKVIRQNEVLNDLAKLLACLVSNDASMTYTYGCIAATINIRGSPSGKKAHYLSTTVHRLFDFILLQATKLRNPIEVVFRVEEYMQWTGLQCKKVASMQVRRDLDILKAIQVEYTGNNERIGLQWDSLCEQASVSRGTIKFRPSEAFLPIISGKKVMPYPVLLGKLDMKKNPNSYCILRKLVEHTNMNYWKSNKGILSVKSLLKCCGKIPTYEQVVKTDRHVRSRIILPFERDLNILAENESDGDGGLVVWHYSKNIEGNPSQNYTDFSRENVVYEWTTYPERKKKERLPSTGKGRNDKKWKRKPK